MYISKSIYNRLKDDIGHTDKKGKALVSSESHGEVPGPPQSVWPQRVSGPTQTDCGGGCCWQCLCLLSVETAIAARSGPQVGFVRFSFRSAPRQNFSHGQVRIKIPCPRCPAVWRRPSSWKSPGAFRWFLSSMLAPPGAGTVEGIVRGRPPRRCPPARHSGQPESPVSQPE